MRYAVRRLRRKMPKAAIVLGCWMKDIDAAAVERLRSEAKVDLVATSLGAALKLCIEQTGADVHPLAPAVSESGETNAA